MTPLCRRFGLFAVACGLAGCPPASVPDGGSDAGCSGCDLVGCSIEGSSYAPGTFNPAAVCQVCEPLSSPTDWTGVLDGTLCDAGSVCAKGECLPGCFIDGFYAAAYGGNPDDSCELCDPEQSLSSWTIDGGDGTACTGDGGNFCQQGACLSECEIGGTFYLAGAANPVETCQSCQPETDAGGWSDQPDLTPCDEDGGYLCVSGGCVAGCSVDGGVVLPGTPNLQNDCFGCQPQLSPLGNTQFPDGTPCTTLTGGTVCQGGACINGCDIGGVFYPDGTLDAGPGGNSNVCCNGAVSATAWSPGFGAATQLPTAVEPEAIAIGDVNGDLIPDLVVAHAGTGQVGILLGQADGTFATEELIAVGKGPRALALADLTGNGRTDVVVVNGGASTLTVLLQQGDGGLLPAPGSPFATPPAPTSVVAAVLDIAFPPALVICDDGNGGEVTVWPANIDGGYQPLVRYPVGLQPVGLVVNDFEHTSSPDVATADVGDSTLTILHNSGDALVPPGTTIALPFAPSAIASGDFNGDGYPDLAVAGQAPDGGVVAIYLNQKGALDAQDAGVWFVASPQLFAVGAFPSALAAADLNGDSLTDLAVTSQAGGTVNVLSNETVTGATTAVFLPPVSYAVGKQPTGVAVGKLEGNANPDLAVANIGSPFVSILPGNCP
jgi:hypothetical protein